jgi:DAK2 domain fusion protein YloV
VVATTVPLDLAAARRWALAARALLAEAREQIDALNVFPVPDGDTGSNMFLTVDGALDVLRGRYQAGQAPTTLPDGLALIARGMLLSARGNSGVIFSQLSRGLYEAVAAAGPVEVVDPRVLADGFERADSLAWAAVSEPVEGTILSVSRAAARAAGRAAAAPGATVLTVAESALEAAQDALAETPRQLAVLARAGVVDAGGAGFVVLLRALVAVLGDSVPDAAEQRRWLEGAASADLPEGTRLQAPEDDGVGDGAYEVMYLLTGSDPGRAEHLRAHLARIGSSVLVVGGPDQWRVHVHLDEPEAAVEAGALAGHLEQVSVTALPGAGAQPGRARVAPVREHGVVACVPGEGLAATFSAAGAEVVHSAPGARASTGVLLSAVLSVPAREVLLLPNDPDTVLAARAAATEAEHDEVRVHVIPSHSVVQGMAALAVYDPGAGVEDALGAMVEAVQATRHGAVAHATRDSDTPAGPCRAGQPLGLVAGRIEVVADDVAEAARGVLQRLCTPGTELVTLVRGAEAGPDELDPVVADLLAAHPDLEVQTLDGGQGTYRWLLGAE